VSEADFPYSFTKTDSLAEVRGRWAHLPAGSETGEEVVVAGRAMLMRPQGRLCFAELRDWTGSLQLFAGAEFTDRYESFVKLAVGDWVGARGQVMTTKRGELSVKVADWLLLAKARIGFGDKWHGLSDVDERWRHREVDLWANSGPREILLLRSKIVCYLRRFFESRGFVEVETPVLHPIPGGALARPFVTHHNALDADFYLRIAPELYLKRLVVGGFEKVFEIGRVFRNEGLSPRHNPEFTMLEAYQAYADYFAMMELVEELVSGAAQELRHSRLIEYQGRPLDLSLPWRRVSMAELLSQRLGREVSLAMGKDELSKIARAEGVAVEEAWGAGKVMLELYEKTVEPELWGPIFVLDYPEEVSPLARPHRSQPGVVERFEAIVAGREMANAFSELTDPDRQRANMEQQARAKAQGDAEAMVVDEDYLFALEHGLPPTGGLGVGVDRLVMLLADVANIREVIAFPTLAPLRR
jgi:lysyl-tRNA synthetase class 2